METLNEKEWLLINDIVKELYTATEFKELGETFLLLIRKLVPYKSAGFTVLELGSFTVDADKSVIIGDNEDTVDRYNEKYAEKDYTNDVLSFPKSTAYRDSDIIDEEQKLQTEFYRDWLKKAGTDYLGGLVIKPDEAPISCITFFRSKLYGPLKDKELFILELFIGHLENIISGFVKNKREYGTDYTKVDGYELLSEREREIFPYIIHGYSNSELGQKFCISESTAKKHVYNILVKCGAGSRGELIRNCFENDD